MIFLSVGEEDSSEMAESTFESSARSEAMMMDDVPRR